MRPRTVHTWVVLALAVMAMFPASAEARSIRPPALGTWEGEGPHGLALSFQLGRAGSRIHAEALAVTVPVGCPATVRNALAVAGTKTLYAGPRAAPPGLPYPIFGKPGTIGLSLIAPHYRVQLEGPLINPRRVVLTLAAPSGRNTVCWPRTLRFTARPAPRVTVYDGHWAGTLTSANGVTGTIRLQVAGRGRAVSSFSFALYCPGNTNSGSPGYSFGPDVNGQFIEANGTFSGPAAHSAAPGLRIAWQGRFAAGKVTGTLANLGDPCGLGASQSATFTARHAS